MCSQTAILRGAPRPLQPECGHFSWPCKRDRSCTATRAPASGARKFVTRRRPGPPALVLRTWAAAKTLPAHFSGQVFNRSTSKYIPGGRVILRGDKTFSAVSDSQGRFLIDNVPPGIYVAATDPPMDTSLFQIDLTKSWCVERTLIIK